MLNRLFPPPSGLPIVTKVDCINAQTVTKPFHIWKQTPDTPREVSTTIYACLGNIFEYTILLSHSSSFTFSGMQR